LKKALRSQIKFKKTVFPNGLTLVTERHPGYRSLSLGVWVKAGTRHERGSESGVCHFLEHMLFKGTGKRSALDIALEVDRVGGEFNAFTGREYTCFHLLLLDRDVNLGVDILSDVLLDSRFDSLEMERERKVILQEINMVEEAPEELVHDLFFEIAYPRHGLGRPILGTESSIRRMSRSDMIRFFRKHYRPHQLVFSVAGDVAHETVKKKLRALSRKIWPGRPPKKSTRKELGFAPAPPLREGTWWVKRNTEQVHLVWGVEGPKYTSRDRFAAYLLNVFLGGGMSSSLFQEIREKNGLAYTVYSSLSSFIDSGVFTIYAATSMKQVPLCLRLIEECAARLKKELLTEEELHVIKENLKGNILLNADGVEPRMMSIAKNEIFFGKYINPDDVCRMIDEVTPQDVRRVARKLLGTGRRSILLLGPRPPRSVAKKVRPQFPKRYQR
jgi:predicted Zn-dependent peptidase